MNSKILVLSNVLCSACASSKNDDFKSACMIAISFFPHKDLRFALDITRFILLSRSY